MEGLFVSNVPSHRSWREMKVEFNLKGLPPIEFKEKTQADPLMMEDCAGTFLLWAVMICTAFPGLVIQQIDIPQLSL